MVSDERAAKVSSNCLVTNWSSLTTVGSTRVQSTNAVYPDIQSRLALFPKLCWCIQISVEVLTVFQTINYGCNFSVCAGCVFVSGSGAVCWKPPMFPLMNVNDKIVSHSRAALMSANVTDHVLKACLSLLSCLHMAPLPPPAPADTLW